MQTPDEESLRSTLRNLEDQLEEAGKALAHLEAHAAQHKHPHAFVAASAEELDGEDYTFRVPTHFVIHAIREWQQVARIAHLEALKKLEGLR